MFPPLLCHSHWLFYGAAYGCTYVRADSDIITKTKISGIVRLPYFLTSGASARGARLLGRRFFYATEGKIYISCIFFLILIGSSTPGVVQVRVLNTVGERTISSNTVPFEYTEKKDRYKEERRRQRRNYLDGELKTSEDFLEMMSLLLERMPNLELKSKDGASCNGKPQTDNISRLFISRETEGW